MREFKAYVGYGATDRITSIEPINKSPTEAINYKLMTVRVLTEEEVDREVSECMQEGCHTYVRKNSRIRQLR